MIHPAAKVSEEVNRKCHARNTTEQLSTPYTDPAGNNTQRYRQTDRLTDILMPVADWPTVRSAKNWTYKLPE